MQTYMCLFGNGMNFYKGLRAQALHKQFVKAPGAKHSVGWVSLQPK